ncbi:unnamed protein product [Effrenium voratum]|nr:unnamed protein product [Effrenium voratum]
MGKDKQDEWELLERLSVKELRLQALRKCVPLAQISAAIEKSDLIGLIVKAGPVLDQYDVSVGAKVWTAESIESHQPGKAKKDKEKKSKKEKPKEPEKKKKKKGDGSSASEAQAPKKSKRGRRSPSLTMMLPADAPEQVANPEAAMKALLPPEPPAPAPKALPVKAKDEAPAVIDDDDDDAVAVVGTVPPPAPAPGAKAAGKRRRREPVEVNDDEEEQEKRRKEKEKKAKEKKEKAEREKERKEREAKEKEEKAAAERERGEPSSELPGESLGLPQARRTANTAQVGVAAAAALGFDVLPKQSSFTSNAPAPGLRPSVNPAAAAAAAGANLQGHRVCVQYLCFTRCDKGSSCPEAHIMDPEEEMRVRAKFKLQECNQGAGCTRTSCLFRHPGERVEEANLGQASKAR